MKINLSGWYKGLIGLESRVIDLSRRQIRPRTSEEELERYYDECIEKLGGHRQYFENQKAFEQTREELAESKRAKLVARDSVYPSLFDFMHDLRSLESILDPEKGIKKEKHFYVGQCLIRIPIADGSPFVELIGSSSKGISESEEGIREIVGDYMCVIEIPNDSIPAEAKSTTFHESLHYFIISYQINSGRLFTKDEAGHSKKERRVAEKCIQESVVEHLVDILLEDNKEALFEQRWLRYELANLRIGLLRAGAALATGSLIGLSPFNPELIPFIPVLYIANTFVYQKYKNSKKEELTQPRERAEFKI